MSLRERLVQDDLIGEEQMLSPEVIEQAVQVMRKADSDRVEDSALCVPDSETSQGLF